MSDDYNTVCVTPKQSAGRYSTVGYGRFDEILDLDEFKLYFLKEHEKLILLANKLFGLNFWSHAITKQDVDSVDYVDGTYSVAASAVVKIILNDGTYHEELGCGFSFKLANKAISIANARQDAKLDGFRKAIISFGYNCEIEENMKVKKNSSIQSPEMSVEKKNSTCPPVTNQNDNKTQSISSPRNSCTKASLPSPQINGPMSSRSEHLERDLRAERKRKQQQLQEEYRSRMKLKEKQPCPMNKENSNGQHLIDSAVESEPSFLSTQEVDEMMKSAAVLLKPESSNYRLPLISSPAQNSNHSWSSIRNRRKAPENSRTNELFIN